MAHKEPVSVFWFRRDLRLDDNAGLYHALRSGHPVLPIFIFDTNILDGLEDKADKRLQFIHDTLTTMQEELIALHSSLHVLYGTPEECFKKLISVYTIAAVYTNEDYEPYATKRDKEINAFLQKSEVPFHSFKDQVIFSKEEVVKDNKDPYTVFTPYSRKWKEKLTDFFLKPYPTKKYFHSFYKHSNITIPSLKEMGFEQIAHGIHNPQLHGALLSNYDKTRDYPGIIGTTHWSPHLRFGTVSIRKLATIAQRSNATLLNELIWREFYQMILWHFPHVVNHSFKKEYDNIEWRNNEKEFKLWCNGQTGYPIVDAGMRQLNEIGFMHNRVRMITASFLSKHLLIDWRWGEAYFAIKLLDYDLASNNGGWQWAAGSGCDAAPYFRIFNPYLQTQKFDPDKKYIKQWVPEYESSDYTRPIIEHTEARERCLKVYKEGLNKGR